MSNHLSQDQFESCVLSGAGWPELEHMNECPECRAEVERFSKGMALFRKAVHDLAEEAPLQPVSTVNSGWRWTLATVGAAAALVAAIILPFFISRPEHKEMSPDAVMERLNRHLEGTMPEAMEPAMSLISFEQPGRDEK
jgi:anti-sigma factor RsiW